MHVSGACRARSLIIPLHSQQVPSSPAEGAGEDVISTTKKEARDEPGHDEFRVTETVPS